MDKSSPGGPGSAGSWHRFRVEKPRPGPVPGTRRVSHSGSEQHSPRIKTDHDMDNVEEEDGERGNGDGAGGGGDSSTGGDAGFVPGSSGAALMAPGSTTVAMYACMRCRQSKKKCDRLLPECTGCKRLGARCFFPSPVASTASQAASLRARVTWLSNFVDSLMPVGSQPISCYDTGFDLHSIPHLARLIDGVTARGSMAGPGTGPVQVTVPASAPVALPVSTPGPLPGSASNSAPGSVPVSAPVCLPGSAPGLPMVSEAGPWGGPVTGSVSGPTSGQTMPQAIHEDHPMDGIPTGPTSAGSILQQLSPSSMDIIEPPSYGPHALPASMDYPFSITGGQPGYMSHEIITSKVRLVPIRTYTSRFSHMHLVRAYFRHMHRSYPFLYESAIIDAAESHVGHAVFEEGHIVDLTSSRLYLVMILGLEAISRFGGRRSGGEAYRNATMAMHGHSTSAAVDIDEDDRTVAAEALAQVRMPYLDIIQSCLQNRCIPATEVLLLLTIYALFDPDGWSPWVILGIMGREAVLLGLNRRRSSDTEPRRMIEREFRHRLFWSIFSIDRLVASVYGLALTVQDYDSNLALPGVTTEEFAASEQAEHITTLQIARQAIALRDIEGRCLSLVHFGQGGPSSPHSTALYQQQQHQQYSTLPGLRERRAMIEELRGAADNWYTQGTLLARREAHAVHFHNTITWLNTNYHGMLMLLYCPSLFNSGPSEPQDLLDLHRTIGKYVQSVHAQFVDRQLAFNWTTMSRMLLVCRILLHTYFNLCCGPSQVGGGQVGGSYGGFVSSRPSDSAPEQLSTILAEQLDMILKCESVLYAFQPSWIFARKGAILFRRLEAVFRHRLLQVQGSEVKMSISSSVAGAVAAVPEVPPYYLQKNLKDRNHSQGQNQNQNQNHGYGQNQSPGNGYNNNSGGQRYPQIPPSAHDPHSYYHERTYSPNSPASQMGNGAGGGNSYNGIPPGPSSAAQTVPREDVDITNDIHDICDEVEGLIQRSLGVSSTYNYLAGEPRPRPRRTLGQMA
ncbi:Rac GTPase-activating protein BCR/ABR [Sporothrix bragantina]|uniref:Rac GTPase-activating protein BCR/ABR n=1 Tax=Sporothrix bragantina TaxID=671064 RepID=A0ABP0CBL4_9PEZI